jgi:ABC-type nitrate/sulfonate/bicarbonate transport system ATPase subunit
MERDSFNLGEGMKKELVDVAASKSFNSMNVLEDIKFKLHENEFLVIVGPSGCGKTTMANLLAGLLKPTSGHITMNGEEVDPKVHNISIVFQEPSCIPWRTLWDDITMGLEIKGADKKTIEKRGKEVIKLVGLDGFEGYFPKQISGGMKQRVAIARAYATDPDFLIMDEPFGHLDAQTRYLMQIEIMRIWEKEKKTVVFITNNIEEAAYLATRIIVFSKLPARIKGEYEINLPRPRDLTSPEFLKARAEITEQCEVVG